MESRGLRAPLSPSEEQTLRRLALGISTFRELPEPALARLRRLGVVDDTNRLTPNGHTLYESLSRPQKAAALSEQRLVSLLAAMKNSSIS
jgi:hypothetical protein